MQCLSWSQPPDWLASLSGCRRDASSVTGHSSRQDGRPVTVCLASHFRLRAVSKRPTTRREWFIASVAGRAPAVLSPAVRSDFREGTSHASFSNTLFNHRRWKPASVRSAHTLTIFGFVLATRSMSGWMQQAHKAGDFVYSAQGHSIQIGQQRARYKQN